MGHRSIRVGKLVRKKVKEQRMTELQVLRWQRDLPTPSIVFTLSESIIYGMWHCVKGAMLIKQHDDGLYYPSDVRYFPEDLIRAMFATISSPINWRDFHHMHPAQERLLKFMSGTEDLEQVLTSHLGQEDLTYEDKSD